MSRNGVRTLTVKIQSNSSAVTAAIGLVEAIGALGREPPRHGAADPARSAGHQRGPAGQLSG